MATSPSASTGVDPGVTPRAIRGRPLCSTLAAVAWLAALAGIIIHRLGPHHGRSTLEVYVLAGQHWLNGEYLYGDWRGFVYSPLAAVFFALLALPPLPLAGLCWLALNSAALLCGLHAVLRARLFPAIERRHFAAVFLLILPLAIGNLDVMQANPLVAGLILFAFASAAAAKWSTSAASIALATYLKIYPIAAGMLLCVIAPRRMGWRLLLFLAALGLTVFAMQHPHYVAAQYRAWAETRLADNRASYSEKDAPLDLWYILTRTAHLPLQFAWYRALEIAAGAGIALFNLVGARRGWPQTRLLAGSFVLVSIWMTLLGPATESYTYILLAPAAALCLVNAFAARQPLPMRAAASAAYLLLLAAVARNSFAPHFHPAWMLAAQPLGAAALLAYAVPWLRQGTDEANAAREPV